MARRSRRFLLSLAPFVLGFAVLAGTLYFSVVGHDPAAVGASAIGGPFTLAEGNGSVVTDADFRGEPTVVFFGYTHCPDVCPTTLSDLSNIFAKVGSSKKLAGLFVTVDPERDTPSVMQDYVSNFDPRIVGLSGDRAEIDAAMKDYRVYAKKVPAENGDYSMDHSAIVYLMDKQGRFVTPLDLTEKPEAVAAEISRYL